MSKKYNYYKAKRKNKNETTKKSTKYTKPSKVKVGSYSDIVKKDEETIKEKVGSFIQTLRKWLHLDK